MNFVWPTPKEHVQNIQQAQLFVGLTPESDQLTLLICKINTSERQRFT